MSLDITLYNVGFDHLNRLLRYIESPHNIVNHNGVSISRLLIREMHGYIDDSDKFPRQRFSDITLTIGDYGQTLADAKELIYNPVIESGILDQPVKTLDLYTRTTNMLEAEGIRTIRQLVSFSPFYLSELRDCGALSIQEIQRRLASHGLSLQRYEEWDDIPDHLFENITPQTSMWRFAFPSRIRRALEEGGIQRIEDLCHYQRDEVAVLRDVGEKTMKYLDKALAHLGLQFKD